jgi:hypothetical protein
MADYAMLIRPTRYALRPRYLFWQGHHRWSIKMDAASYMREIVDPTIHDFELNPKSRRHAFLACVTTFHCVDYLSFPKRPKNLREQLRNENSDFALVDRVAHALKHVESGNPNAAQNQPLKVEEVLERPPAIWGQAVWDVSRWDDQQGGVEIAKEERDDLLDIVKRAVEFLRGKL